METETLNTLLTGLFGGTVISSFLKGPADTVQNFWFSKIGYKIDQGSIMKKIDNEKFEAQYRKLKEKKELTLDEEVSLLIDKKLKEISDENVKSPEKTLLIPALEALPIYSDKEEIRNLFTSMIASTFDSSVEEFIHPAFIDIAKQLSVVDYHNLKYIFESHSGNGRISSISFQFPGGSTTRYSNVYLDNPKYTNHNIQSASIINLQRLGLVSLNDNFTLGNTGSYAFVKESDQYKETEHFVKSIIESSSGVYPPNIDAKLLISVTEGALFSTTFGDNFYKVCL